MNLPLISVAIPAYNHAAYIEACLQSVCSQTYPEFEIVLIDDGSKDDTFARASAFLDHNRARFKNIVCQTRPNKGVSATSNECIRAASGEWVHLLGSDDLLHPDKIMRQWEAVNAWAEPRLALIYADADFIDENGNRTLKPFKHRPPPGPDDRAYIWLLHTNYIPNPTVALRKAAFLDAGGFDETLRLEDWDCWLRIAAQYPIARVPEVLASYRRHSTNASKNQQMMLEAMLLTFAKFLERNGASVPNDVVARSYRKNLRRLWRWSAHNNKKALPRIVMDAAFSHLAAPTAADYRRYAGGVARCKKAP